MFYKTVLFSAIGQCESAIHIHMNPPSWTPLLPCTSSPFSVVPDHQVEFPVLYSNFPLALCVTYGYVYVQCCSLNSSHHLFPLLCLKPVLCLHFYSCPANRFISTTYLVPHMSHQEDFNTIFLYPNNSILKYLISLKYGVYIYIYIYIPIHQHKYTHYLCTICFSVIIQK